MDALNKNCFGFFNDSISCKNCPAEKRCRAILISDGFEVVAAMLEVILDQEEESGVPFYAKQKISDNVDQLLNRKSREGLATDDDTLVELFGTEAVRMGTAKELLDI